MLQKMDIKNGILVYNENKKTYGYLDDVGNAREKGHRGESTTPEDELSYSFIDIVSGKKEIGICEYSHMTSNWLSIATVEDVEIHLQLLEADSIKKLAKAKKRIAKVREANNRLQNLRYIQAINT